MSDRPLKAAVSETSAQELASRLTASKASKLSTSKASKLSTSKASKVRS